MRARTIPIIVVLGLGVATSGAYGDAADNWPTWRGPLSNGVAVKGEPPVTWSETENIKWKVPLPGIGSSTPIVWGNKIFLTTAVRTKEESPSAPPRRGPGGGVNPTVPYKFNVVCMSRETGSVLWERTVREEVPHEGHHPTGSFASYSPVTDGEYVWASFGSRGLHCYDLDGNHEWSTDLIKMTTKLTFGEGSSPALASDTVIVVLDHERNSKIAAFDKMTGELIWETARDSSTSWGTPFVVEVGSQVQVVTNATGSIRSYDASTGELIWQCDGLTPNSIPSPVSGFGNVYCTSGFRGSDLKAIKLGRTGDLSGSDAIVWQVNRGTPYVASPLLYEDKIYVLSSLSATLSCYKAETGDPVFLNERIPGLRQIYASPVGAGGRIYIADREGTVAVIKLSDTFEILAMNSLDDGFDASPVVVGDELYLKGSEHLYCIAEQ